jgi:preprotein translocase subunit SecE
MGGTVSTEKTKKSWFKGLKAEFKKVIWPDKMTVTKRTTAVVLISILIGVVIKIADLLIQAAFSLLF